MPFSRPVRLATSLGPVLVALVLAGCSTDTQAPASADASVEAAGEGPAASGGPKVPLTAAGCIDLSSYRPTPIRARGKLVVTFYDKEKQARLCDWDDETKQHWCPSATKTSPSCANVLGTTWCPTASPSPDQLGDAQELAAFDLESPGAGPQRWTTNNVHEAELDISPDGKRVVYAVRNKMDDFENGQGIWVSDSDGKNARKVVDRAGHTGIPTWLPPGNDKFTFIADGLHVFDMGSGQTIDVAIDGFDSGLVIDPEPSHDGKRLTFKADASGGNVPTIYVIDFDGRRGTNLRHLTKGFSDHDPVFSRDNTKIYFERYYGPGEWFQPDVDKIQHPEINQWGIVEVDASSGSERVIIPHDTCGKHFFWLPTVSPDGKHLMFIHDYVAEDGYQDLWISDIDGGNAQPVEGTRGFHWFDWE